MQTPCRRLKPILDEVEQEQAGKLKLVQVDAYAEAELAAHHRVSSVPALFVYRQGQCVDQRLGLASKSELLRWLDGTR